MIEQKTIRVHNTDIHYQVIDINQYDVYPVGDFKNQKTVTQLARENKVAAAINFPYFGVGYIIGYQVMGDGRQIGTAEQKARSWDGFYRDDKGYGIKPIFGDRSILHGVQAGPRLLESGRVVVRESAIKHGFLNADGSRNSQSNVLDAAQHSALGIRADGHIVFVASDGRTARSPGLILEQLAVVMRDFLGCVDALNGDGGGSVVMVDGKGNRVNQISHAERNVGVALIAVPIEQAKEDKPVNDNKVVVIDPGHGGADPGAVAKGFGLREKDLTLTIAKLVRHHLETNYVVDVRMTRDIDKTMDLKERTDFANALNADYFLSIHVNAFNGSARGYEDFIFANLPDTGHTAKLRDAIHAEIVPVLHKYGVPNRGKKKANFHVLRETKMPAALTETLFIDNKADQQLLVNEQFIKDISKAHAEGVAKALQLPKKPKPEPKPEQSPSPGGQPGLHRVIVDGVQIGAWGQMSYLLRNIEKAIDSGGNEIKIERVK